MESTPTTPLKPTCLPTSVGSAYEQHSTPSTMGALMSFSDIANKQSYNDDKIGLPSDEASASLHPACWPISSDLVRPPSPRTYAARSRIPIEFPPILAAPYGLPVRINPQSALKALDHATYGSTPETLTGEAGGTEAGGTAGLGISMNEPQTNPPGHLRGIAVRNRDHAVEDLSRNKEAMKRLEAHIRERVPYVQLASRNLQALMGLRNEMPFKLPKSSTQMPSLSSAFKTVGNMSGVMDLDSSGGAAAKVRGASGNDRAEPDREMGSMLPPKLPQGMHVVDMQTGMGLREFLLAKGKEVGNRKRQCKSISFHDFTPEMQSMTYQNVLLGHYGTEMGGKVDVYEIDLPVVSLNAETGQSTHNAETWIWILIQRPIVTFEPADTSSSTPGNAILRSAAATFLPSFAQVANDSQTTTTHPTLPPNFPEPIPHSWLVFAAPMAHLTIYPETVESNLAAAPTSSGPQGGRELSKRIDYDFSHQGTPLFEFSGFAGRRMEFLSVERMDPFCKGDSWEDYTKEEYESVHADWLTRLERRGVKFSASETGNNGAPDGCMPSPHKGAWWKEFYYRVGEDCEKWRRVRRAMGRGRCRVVLRWNEIEGNEDDQMDGGRGRGAGRIRGLKERLNASTGIDGRMRRLTRSESRRRSALGLSDPSIPTMSAAAAGEMKKGKERRK